MRVDSTYKCRKGHQKKKPCLKAMSFTEPAEDARQSGLHNACEEEQLMGTWRRQLSERATAKIAEASSGSFSVAGSPAVGKRY